MATVKKNVLGDLRGKIGNMSARMYNGKPVFVSLPSSFNTPNDVDSILRRNRFSAAVKMTKEILSVPNVKEIWKEQNNTKMNTYNYLMKTNYKYLDGYQISTFNQITPITGFSFSYSNITLNDNSVSVDIDPLNIVQTTDTTVSLLILFQFLDPVIEEEQPFSMSLLISNSMELQLSQTLSFTLEYTDYITGSNLLYQNKKLLLSLITEDAQGNLVNYSSTKLHTP